MGKDCRHPLALSGEQNRRQDHMIQEMHSNCAGACQRICCKEGLSRDVYSDGDRIGKATSVNGLDAGSGGGQDRGNSAGVFGCTILIVHVRIFRQRGQSLRIAPQRDAMWRTAGTAAAETTARSRKPKAVAAIVLAIGYRMVVLRFRIPRRFAAYSGAKRSKLTAPAARRPWPPCPHYVARPPGRRRTGASGRSSRAARSRARRTTAPCRAGGSPRAR